MRSGRLRVALMGLLLLPLMTWTASAAQAEEWVAVGPAGSTLWYDSERVRITSDRRIAVWLSNAPARTETGANGITNYPTYTLIDCKDRKAGSKISLDNGKPLQVYAAASSMGALIAKLCA
jgi:hypothetical protein